MHNIVMSGFADVPLPDNVSLSDFLWRENAAKHGNKVALVDGITGKSFTYAKGWAESRRFGHALVKELSVRKGDVVAFVLPNSPEYVTCWTGVVGIGAVVAGMNPASPAAELSRQLEMTRPKLVLTTSASHPVVVEALQGGKGSSGWGFSGEVVILDDGNVPGTRSYSELVKGDVDDQLEPCVLDPNSVAMLAFSSGTTGLPKAVMHASSNIMANISIVVSKELEMFDHATDAYQPKTICMLPMFHAGGNHVTSFPLLKTGGQVVTLPNFQPDTFIDALEKHKPTFLHLPPSILSFLANHPDVKPHHLESVHYMMGVGSALGEGLVKRLLSKAPHVNIRGVWGMTEALVCTLAPNGNSMVGSCGVLVPNTEAKIIDLDTGQPLGPGKKGELCLRGPQLMRGYYNNPDATRDTVRDGFIHTGDLAYYDDDNRFYIVCRLKEVIKVNGMQVAPAELEDLIRSHPGVEDAAVIGVPDDESSSEAPLAFVVKKPGSGLKAEEVQGFVAENIVAYKHLTGGVKFVDIIPRTPVGKIIRGELMKML